MDIVTHGLMGAILASPLFPTQPLSAAALAFGNVLPDLDSLSRCAGKRAFLATHQGPTHAYASALVAGLGLDLGLRLLAPGWHEPLAGPALALGMVIHSTLDYTNTFGIQLFAPFSRQRRACEWVFFIDATVLLLSALALCGANHRLDADATRPTIAAPAPPPPAPWSAPGLSIGAAVRA